MRINLKSIHLSITRWLRKIRCSIEISKLFKAGLTGPNGCVLLAIWAEQPLCIYAIVWSYLPTSGLWMILPKRHQIY